MNHSKGLQTKGYLFEIDYKIQSVHVVQMILAQGEPLDYDEV